MGKLLDAWNRLRMKTKVDDETKKDIKSIAGDTFKFLEKLDRAFTDSLFNEKRRLKDGKKTS